MKTNIIKTKIVLILSFIMLTCLMLQACDMGKHVNTNTGKAWYVEPDGSIQTDDFERLQRETPFKIIRPEHLPNELIFSPVMFIKTIGMNSKNDVDVRFAYWNSPKGITIEETDYTYTQEPNEEMENIYLDVNGTRILQEKYRNFVSSKEVVVYSYTWNRNSISFVVDVWDYDETEARKVVESMIK